MTLTLRKHRHTVLTAAVLTLWGAAATAADFDIAAQPLDTALAQLARQAGLQLLAKPELVQSRLSGMVRGSMAPQDAARQLLRGSGLTGRIEGTTLVVERVPSSASLSEVTVTAQAAPPIDALPTPYTGGQVARGGRVGLLGNTDLLSTPFSTTGYTSQAIEDQQATTVSQVLRVDPSVRELFPEGGPSEHLNVRGFYMQSHEFAWNGLFGLVPHNRGATEMLERVEILRGPGALLYGMALGGSVGGVVNLVPKRADDVPISRVTASLASDAKLGGHLDLGRRFGVDHALGVRVNLAKGKGDLAVDGQSQDRGLGSVALDFRGERLRATVDAYGIEDKLSGGMPLMTTFATASIPRAPDPTLNSMPGAYSSSRSKAVIGSVEYDFNDQWTGFAAVGTKRQAGTGHLNNALGMNAQPSGAYTGLGMNVKNFFDANSVDAGIRGHLSTGPVTHKLVLSANAVKQTSGAVVNRALWASNLYAPTAPARTVEPAFAPKQSDTKLTSLALADTLSFLDDTYLLTLGARHQRVRTTTYAASGATTSHYDEDALTPAVGFVARPWAVPVSVYANYIEGLSQGGRVTDSTAANFGEIFPPYKSKQIEVGTKWDAGTMLHTLSFFQITRPSLIKDAATNLYAPNGEQRNRGVEWTIAGEVTKGLRLMGGATYIRALNTKTNGGLLNGKTTIGVPRWQFNLSTEWDLPAVRGLSLRADTIHTGGQFADATNTQALPAWTRLDLGVRFATQFTGHKLVLRGNLVNALNKRYWSGIWNGYASVGAPRTIELSVSTDF